MRLLDRHPSSWLLVGAALVALANVRFPLGALAWLAWVPFLRFLRSHPGPRPALLTLAALALGWTLATAKICTAPIPLAMSPLYGVPIAMFTGLPLVASAAVRRRLDHPLSAALFPAAMVVGEWAQHALTPLGSWGAAAYTQLDALPLLQVASVAGLAGPSFLVYLGNAALEDALHRGPSRLTGVTAGLLTAALTLGHARLAANQSATDTVRVAAVGTDATFAGLPLPTAAERATSDDALERRIRLAAAGGARLIVTTEASALALPAEVDPWLTRWRALASELGVTLVVGHVVPLSTDPLRYDNLAQVIPPSGPLPPAWRKHHPVPGEPAVAGDGLPDPTLVNTLRLGTAVCYDADFPRLGLALAGQGLDLLAVPSSDWRGIDPVHTEMARLRAIEGGYGLVRSTRFGSSAVYDRLGRARGMESAFDTGARVLIAEVPAHGSTTLYARLGDWLVLASALALTVTGLAATASGFAARRRVTAPGVGTHVAS